jgi:hypothetical protein
LAQTEIQSQNQPQHRQINDLSELEGISERLWEIAQAQQGEPDRLLQILRVLEATHKRIRDDLFQPALPTSRHELFNLLRDIETNFVGVDREIKQAKQTEMDRQQYLKDRAVLDQKYGNRFK